MNQITEKLEITPIIATGLVLLLALLTAQGCASYTIRDSTGAILSQGSATGILRTITVVETYDKDGKIKQRKISTDSTTKDVLLGLDKFIDTTINTAAKIKP